MKKRGSKWKFDSPRAVLQVHDGGHRYLRERGFHHECEYCIHFCECSERNLYRPGPKMLNIGARSTYMSALLSHQLGELFYCHTIWYFGNNQRLTIWIVVWMLDDKSLTVSALVANPRGISVPNVV